MGGRRTTLGAAAMVAVLSASLAAPAAGQPRPKPRPTGGSDTIVSSGVCDAGSTWTLTGRSRFLRIVVGARVDTDRGRQRWVLRIKRDRTTVARVSRKSNGRGVVRVKGKVRNRPGADTFTFIARNRTSAETCRGTLTF
ncbi:MAG: hypothetical protein R2720_08255 [Candidatus Nanopelagicales bacterium]